MMSDQRMLQITPHGVLTRVPEKIPRRYGCCFTGFADLDSIFAKIQPGSHFFPVQEKALAARELVARGRPRQNSIGSKPLA